MPANHVRGRVRPAWSEELIGKGLIWSPRRGMIDFTVPRFAQCLRVTHAPGPAERDAPPL
jgi:hypothetical protein